MCRAAALCLVWACAVESTPTPVEMECEGARAHKLLGRSSQCSAFPLEGRWVTAGHCVDDADLVEIAGWGPVLFTSAQWEGVWDYALSDPGTAPEGFKIGDSGELYDKDLVVMWGFPSGKETIQFGEFVDSTQEDILVTTQAMPGFSGGVFISGQCTAVGIVSYHFDSGYTGGNKLDQIEELQAD